MDRFAISLECDPKFRPVDHNRHNLTRYLDPAPRNALILIDLYLRDRTYLEVS
jgi:hypothetical protein